MLRSTKLGTNISCQDFQFNTFDSNSTRICALYSMWVIINLVCIHLIQEWIQIFSFKLQDEDGVSTEGLSYGKITYRIECASSFHTARNGHSLYIWF